MKSLIGTVVIYRVNGVEVIWGLAEYLTADGWYGIRQVGGRLDEAPARMCEPDPT